MSIKHFENKFRFKTQKLNEYLGFFMFLKDQLNTSDVYIISVLPLPSLKKLFNVINFSSSG